MAEPLKDTPRQETATPKIVDAWSLATAPLLVQQLEAERQALLHSGSLTDIRAHQLQLTSRNLSEMDLCESWRRNIPLPPGFHLIVGRVCPSDVPSRYAVAHIYAMNHEGFVICTTPGQFIAPIDRLPPGQRLAILQAQAPDLIRTFDNGLTILAAPRQEIHDRLHLSYLPGLVW